MNEPGTFETLCTERRNAAFNLVGVVSALLHLSKTFKEPIDAKALQMAMDKYDVADQAIEAFYLAERTENLEVTR